MEIEDKYLSVENVKEGDIITFIDAGTKEVKVSKADQKPYTIYNFKVSNGRYELIYTPKSVALDIFKKAFGLNTDSWIGKKFGVKIVDTISFGKTSKVIMPQILEIKA